MVLISVVDHRVGVVIAYCEWRGDDPTSSEIASQVAAFRLEFFGPAYGVNVNFAASVEGLHRAAFSGKKILEGAERRVRLAKAGPDLPPLRIADFSASIGQLQEFVAWCQARDRWPPASAEDQAALWREFLHDRTAGWA